MRKQKIKYGFKSKNQLPLFMIWREYRERNKVVFAEVLFNSKDWIGI